jgi:hypothetical protein
MKIKLKDLMPNPYRDMENYPIDRVKIESLKNSFDQTGFWDNIIARAVNGKFQIAYGHHRLVMLREKLTPEDKVDIPVKKLSDALMIKIMAKENDNDWGTNVAVTDETVKAAKQFLEEHPEEVKDFSPGRESYKSKESLKISIFLDWSEDKVYYSLERLGMIERGEIEKEIIESLPHEKAAKRFVSAVKKHPEVTVEKQRTIANKIIKDESFGEKAINDAFIVEKFSTLKKKNDTKKEKLIRLETIISDIRIMVDDLSERLIEFARLESEIGTYDKSVYRKILDVSLFTLINKINLILKTNEKSNESGTDSPNIRGELKN